MNLNDSVKVVLSESGAEIMNAKEQYYSLIVPGLKAHTYKDGDELNVQLWQLFETFGKHINIACNPPFKDNEI